MISVSSIKHLMKLSAIVQRDIDSMKKKRNVKIVSFNMFFVKTLLWYPFIM